MGVALPEDIEHVIRDMHGNVQVLMARTASIEVHQRETNGAVADLRRDALKQEGALAVIKWMIGITIAIVAAGASVAGVVLALVAGG